jgi:hypothetical protein
MTTAKTLHYCYAIQGGKLEQMSPDKLTKYIAYIVIQKWGGGLEMGRCEFDLITYLYTANEKALRHDEHPCKSLLANFTEIGSKKMNRHCSVMNASLIKCFILSTEELGQCFSIDWETVVTPALCQLIIQHLAFIFSKQSNNNSLKVILCCFYNYQFQPP